MEVQRHFSSSVISSLQYRSFENQLLTTPWRKDADIHPTKREINLQRPKDADTLDHYESMIRGWGFVKDVGRNALSYSRQTGKPSYQDYAPAYRKILNFYVEMKGLEQEISETVSREISMRLKFNYTPDTVRTNHKGHLDIMKKHSGLINEAYEAYEKVVCLLNGAGWCTFQMPDLMIDQLEKIYDRTEGRRIKLEEEEIKFDRKLIPFPETSNN